MRDDIHKSVPRPPKVQRWVKRAARESDRLAGRSAAALQEALVEVSMREIRSSLVAQVELGQVEMFGWGGTPIERQLYSEFERLAATGANRTEALCAALAGVLESRAESELRAAEPVLLACGDTAARQCLSQLRNDVKNLDYRALAESRMNPQSRRTEGKTVLSADENLLGLEPMKAGV